MRRLCLVFLGLALVLFGPSSSGAAQDQTTLFVSNPSCSQRVSDTAQCTITINSVSVFSNNPNFLGLQIAINDKVRARFTAFFETSIAVNPAMLGSGLQVPCGRPGASGQANLGFIYNVQVSVLINGSSGPTDSALTACPYYQSKAFLPALRH